MSFTHTHWGIYFIYYGDGDLLNVETGEQQSIFSLVSTIVGEYLLHPVILRMMVNKETLTCQLSFSTVQIGLLPFWELRD